MSDVTAAYAEGQRARKSRDVQLYENPYEVQDINGDVVAVIDSVRALAWRCGWNGHAMPDVLTDREGKEPDQD